MGRAKRRGTTVLVVPKVISSLNQSTSPEKSILPRAGFSIFLTVTRPVVLRPAAR